MCTELVIHLLHFLLCHLGRFLEFFRRGRRGCFLGGCFLGCSFLGSFLLHIIPKSLLLELRMVLHVLFDAGAFDADVLAVLPSSVPTVHLREVQEYHSFHTPTYIINHKQPCKHGVIKKKERKKERTGLDELHDSHGRLGVLLWRKPGRRQDGLAHLASWDHTRSQARR